MRIARGKKNVEKLHFALNRNIQHASVISDFIEQKPIKLRAGARDTTGGRLHKYAQTASFYGFQSRVPDLPCLKQAKSQVDEVISMTSYGKSEVNI